MSGTPTSLSSAVAVLGLAGGSSSHGGLAAVTWAARRGPPGPSTTVPAALFLAGDGRRLDRHGAGRIVRTTARRAGIATAVTPHTLRHAFTTAALGRRVAAAGRAKAASHADPRTTMRYDRARGSPDRHATYVVAAYLAGATR